MPPTSAPPAVPEDPGSEAPGGLSRLAFGICMAILLGIFALLNPLWEPMDMAQMDENILWSYYPIPLLALLALLIERKLRWATFFLESLRLTLVKFVITFLFANVMWAYVTGPPGVPEDGTPDPARVSAGAEPYDAVDSGATERVPYEGPTTPIHGRVVDGDGKPVQDAWVYVNGGLPRHDWPVPGDTLTLSVHAEGFQPERAILPAFQRVLLAASDDLNHTAQAADADGRMLFNYPVLPGSERDLMFDHGLGVVSIRCRTHDHRERPAHFLVLDHPFAVATNDAGAFVIPDVPDGPLTLRVWTETAEAELDLPDTDRGSARMTLR